MTLRTKQILTWVLAITGLYVGLWAAVSPTRFYESFPGFGHEWVAGLGPYNEHLVRDVGGLYLAMAVISVWAAVVRRREPFAMTGLGWLVFDVQHCLFHLRHLDMYSGVDRWGNVVSLVGVSVIAALLLTPTASGAPARVAGSWK